MFALLMLAASLQDQPRPVDPELDQEKLQRPPVWERDVFQRLPPPSAYMDRTLFDFNYRSEADLFRFNYPNPTYSPALFTPSPAFRRAPIYRFAPDPFSYGFFPR